jgi:hypothetical protein
MSLHIPLDFEQLPELCRLRRALALRATGATSPKQYEAIATFVFLRLFVSLGYLAKSTCQPGMLPADDLLNFRATLEPLFGDECDPIKILTEVGLLKRLDGSTELYCELFAKENPHLSGNYQPAHMRGNANSRLKAAENNILSSQSEMDFASKAFQKQEGGDMSEEEKKRSAYIIRMVDRCLKLSERKNNEFHAGIMASACSIDGRYDRDTKIRPFCQWLNLSTRPNIPKTTDVILGRFDEIYLMFLGDQTVSGLNIKSAQK